MGKASRAKRESRARAQAATPAQQPYGWLDDKARQISAVDALVRTVQADDAGALVAAIDRLEQLVSVSVFDIGMGPDVEDEEDETGILDIAESCDAMECLLKLLDLALSRNSRNCMVWVYRLHLDFEELSPDNPRWLFIDRLFRRLFKPRGEEDARRLQQWAIEDSHRPRFVAMALDLAGRFFAQREREVLDSSSHVPSIAGRLRDAIKRL